LQEDDLLDGVAVLEIPAAGLAASQRGSLASTFARRAPPSFLIGKPPSEVLIIRDTARRCVTMPFPPPRGAFLKRGTT
jgi:hypothetical protein